LLKVSIALNCFTVVPPSLQNRRENVFSRGTLRLLVGACHSKIW